jgi:hypothetical protein
MLAGELCHVAIDYEMLNFRAPLSRQEEELDNGGKRVVLEVVPNLAQFFIRKRALAGGFLERHLHGGDGGVIKQAASDAPQIKGAEIFESVVSF